MLATVRATIAKHLLLSPHDCVLVACSGGPDSVALLLALHELAPALDLELCVVHVDHGLRPESTAEAAPVRALATRLGRGFRAATIVVPPGPGGLQERARTARYACLEAVATELGCRRIAVGHTLTDQAETVLHRMVRGAGLEGLGAIAPARGRVVRPLLEVSRTEVLAFLSERGQGFVEDPSNASPAFVRSRVRAEVLPLLESLAPGAERRIASLAADARSALEALRTLTEPWARPSVDSICAAPAAARPIVVREVLRALRGDLRGIGRIHVDAALRLVTAGPAHGEVSLPGGALVRHRDRLTWDPRSGETDPPAS